MHAEHDDDVRAVRAATAPTDSSIQGMLARVHEALRENDANLEVLRERISPVLTPLDEPPSDPAALRTMPVCSGVLSEVTRLLEIVHEQNRALALMAERVEL